MIRLERTRPPAYLTTKRVAALTRSFENNKKLTPWNTKTIRQTLEKMSHGKCAYCESRLESVQQMQIDHFEAKSLNPKRVVSWSNLVPSCGICNSKKSDHDVKSKSIINPFDLDPRTHLRLHSYRFLGITSEGKTTVACVDLNRLDGERFTATQGILNQLLSILNNASLYQNGSSRDIVTRRAIEGGITAALNSCQPTQVYSSTIASMLLNDPHYLEIKSVMIAFHFWSDKIQELEDKAKNIAYF